MAKRNIKTAPKAATKAPAKKAVAKAVSKAVAAKAVRADTMPTVAYANAGSSAYAGLRGVAKGAYTAAAMIVSGIATITDGVLSASDGNLALFDAITDKVSAYHRSKFGRFDGKGLTPVGVEHFNARNEGKASTYNTHATTIADFVQAMREGGTVMIAGAGEVKVTRKVETGFKKA